MLGRLLVVLGMKLLKNMFYALFMPAWSIWTLLCWWVIYQIVLACMPSASSGWDLFTLNGLFTILVCALVALPLSFIGVRFERHWRVSERADTDKDFELFFNAGFTSGRLAGERDERNRRRAIERANADQDGAS